MKFKKNEVVFEVKDPAHIAAFRAARWQELTEPEQGKADVENTEDKSEGNVENSVETVKNAKPKRVKA